MTLTDKQELARLLTLYQQEMIKHNEENIAERKNTKTAGKAIITQAQRRNTTTPAL